MKTNRMSWRYSNIPRLQSTLIRPRISKGRASPFLPRRLYCTSRTFPICKRQMHQDIQSRQSCMNFVQSVQPLCSPFISGSVEPDQKPFRCLAVFPPQCGGHSHKVSSSSGRIIAAAKDPYKYGTASGTQCYAQRKNDYNDYY